VPDGIEGATHRQKITKGKTHPRSPHSSVALNAACMQRICRRLASCTATSLSRGLASATNQPLQHTNTFANSHLARKMSSSSITIDNINEKVKDMQYAVRGAIVAKAGQIEAKLAADPSSYPFDKIIMCNIGNPQSLGQKPITFYRQVLSLCDYPEVRASLGDSDFLAFSSSGFFRTFRAVWGGGDRAPQLSPSP
jgi:hypothetical protein